MRVGPETPRQSSAETTQTSGHARVLEPQRAATVGRLAHATIALLCQQGVRATEPYITLLRIVDAAAQASGNVKLRNIEQRVVRHRVVTVASVYVHRCLPPPDWQWVGADIRLDGSRPDLVWRGPDGSVVVDEIKVSSHRETHAAVRDQLLRHSRAAAKHWPGHFKGARLLWLTQPRLSQWLARGAVTAVPLSPQLWEEM